MSFNRSKHLRYWRMCASILPDAYQSSDASRMSLAFFIASALDLLGLLDDITDHPDPAPAKTPQISATERQSWVEWIYSCQLPDGQGFRGFPGTQLGDRHNDANARWDPGNLPNTFFALAALVVLGDGLGRVRRSEILEWVPKLQREDGSFGEILAGDGSGGVEGGRDLRYCCCAVGIVYMLGGEGDVSGSGAEWFDEERLVGYILSCQGVDGGFGESPLRESHSGLSYCAVATLELLKRLGCERAKRALGGEGGVERCVRWMLERQTTVLQEDEDEEEDGDEDGEGDDTASSDTSLVVGFNGRDNKIADTCYCFWNSGALAILEGLHLADLQGVRAYLLEKVQHMIGGFAKGLDSPPDVMHSYLGLATLALYGEEGFPSLDPALCISKRAAARLQSLEWHRQKGMT